MEKLVPLREWYFVYRDNSGKVTIPTWDIYNPFPIKYLEISNKTVEKWPSWLKGKSLQYEELIF
jgi:hypothetical protein